ncbi:MAG: HAMP domain-containing histidine kinase [Bacteroidales bacterium]|nr:HAMP domain-containing histidine kinase [Bacteroidales bacterium]
METKFAPPERDTQKVVKNEFNQLKKDVYIHEILNSLPYIAAVLNDKRQIIYSNEILLKELGIKTIECVIGMRPGEAINCIHANEEPGGCGTAESCRVCGAAVTILKAQESGYKETSECRIRVKRNEHEESLVFQITAKPFHWQDNKFIIITLNDISQEKQRRTLERIFFHDVINIAGTLNGFLELMQEQQDEQSMKKMVNTAVSLNKDLIEEIMAQRELSAAESNDLNVNLEMTNSLEIIENLSRKISQHAVAKNRHLFVDEHSCAVDFQTDPALLRRVLLNMLKNALEATEPDYKVTIGCYTQNDRVIFYVNNPTYMPRKIQLQVFQRSFSTKGAGRGIGTYSIKLLSERYLKGQVWFRTNTMKGTTFYVSLYMQK